MVFGALFTSAMDAEVFSRLRHFFVKDLKDDATFLIAIFSFLADSYVEVSLTVFWVEVWQFAVVLCNPRCFFVVVDTFIEEGREAFLGLLGLASFLFLDRFMMCAQSLVGRIQFDCAHNGSHC